MNAEPAFLLHRKAYRETSALVDLLTLNHGRIRAVAHGGQRPGSKSRQRLQPFTPLFISWRGERELKRLTLMESRGQTALLAGEGLLCGLYANEIATRLLPLELPAADVFAFYTALLEALPAPSARALALRRYEWALLEALDATPRFCTPDDQRLDPQARYRFDAQSRAFLPSPQGLEGRMLRYIEQGDWEHAGLANGLKTVMRAALAPHLGTTALRSRELMLELARRRQP
ncbi:DNA replication and repair protein RecO [Vreelandella songnenensis]|uniref:DNA repair protein RecO n=1 Tax=Vreelandella songnenensis TaxID=1176243 RepID=A0A2T0V772_9GAMM|nr:DNA repair protein RecO [Halomonas songnenensis]PRY66039.1 DNA replication and repair protein RecO [Halomonas songnenensis]